MKPDFGGYATKFNVRCSDGAVIERGAFDMDDGAKVPAVWNHNHGTVREVLGHAILHSRDDGVYADVYLNNTSAGRDAKECVAHGDIRCLSIYANNLKRKGPAVVHGKIREVSLVLAGANPKATIDNVDGDIGVMMHADMYEDDAALIYSGDSIDLYHSENDVEDDLEHTEVGQKTNKEIFESMTQEQKDVVYELVGMAVDAAREDDDIDDEEDDENMKHSVFDKNSKTANDFNDDELVHSEILAAVEDGPQYGSLKKSFLAHGITNIEYLFPEAKTLKATPDFIQREMSWVSYVMSKVHRTPFANVKSVFADITEDDARALGYIKGKLKKEEVFTMLKRSTGPQTIYKKQKLDRDDIIDVTDFDMLSWLKAEMRMMLEEEIARAILIGDGRLASSDDKIKESCVRPISGEEALYKDDVTVTGSGDAMAKDFIRQSLLARKDYKGSGSPDLFTTEEMLTTMLLLTDNNGRDLYVDEAALARKLRVNRIVTVPVMENDKNGVLGIITNLVDYNIGADRGGAVNMFDDFDLDYNKQIYLIETRLSGALIKPHSAIVLKKASSTSSGSSGSSGGSDSSGD